MTDIEEEPKPMTVAAMDPLGKCRTCPSWDEVKERARVSHLLDTAIQKIEKKLDAEEYKPTVAEYLKLLQLEKELEDHQSEREVHVTWVGPIAQPEIGK